VSENVDPNLTELRAALADAAKIEALAERSLEVVAVIEAAGAPLGIHPIVVGGMAVYFWTADEAFITRDIDVLMAVPARLAATLAQLGFEKSGDGRHWHLAGTDIFLEAPGADLDRDALVTEVTLQSGRTARILSRADILLDRLDEFQATGHQAVAQQVIVLLKNLSEDQSADLHARAAQRRVAHTLDAMIALAVEIDSGRALPESDELHQIARTAMRAEYTSRQS
jgi:hypothetical protein